MMSDMDAVGLSRRAFLVRSGLGLGALALDVLSHQEAEASNALGAFSRVLPPKVKSVIFLHMVGAPSQLDLFD